MSSRAHFTSINWTTIRRYIPTRRRISSRRACFGPSQVVDHRAFKWSDDDWHGVKLPGQVLYELHIGTFTPEGTWRAAIEKLPHLRDVGVTVCSK